jgi:hypothetical protein
MLGASKLKKIKPSARNLQPLTSSSTFAGEIRKMIILDKPYVSDFLKDTIRQNDIPVLETAYSKTLGLLSDVNFVSEKEAIKAYQENPFLMYTNSENAIDWINQHLGFSDLPAHVDLFKDKFKFREMTKHLLTDFYYRKVMFSELETLDYASLPGKCVLKPVVGFFSMGVYIIESEEQLHTSIQSIRKEIATIENLYPKAVLDTTAFIIEEYLTGDEFAFDAYYNKKGEAVVLGIMKHEFASPSDVSDRVYYTSKEVIEKYIPLFENYLEQLNEIFTLKNFPLHVEVRIDKDERILPIEVNPLRFGAWCTSSDLAYHAFGYNSIAHLLKQQKPDWHKILRGKEGKRCSIVILNNSTGIDPKEIKLVDYDGISQRFTKVIELRKSDFNVQPHFGFLFVETDENSWSEIEEILVDDLKEYVTRH